jgi:phosphoribosylanthranilate isomerase
MPSETRVKICGITNREDALVAAGAGADFLGFIFFSRSPRNVEPAAASKIIAEIRAAFPDVRFVGVFVNEPLENLRRIASETGVDFVQLHGSESSEYCDRVRDAGLRPIKVFKFGKGADPGDWSAFPETEWFLCDTFNAESEGGTGQEFDRALLPQGFPLDRSFLAGGLRPENVAAIVTEANPFAVDVSSGVEAAPGRKDHAKVRKFIGEVRKRNART